MKYDTVILADNPFADAELCWSLLNQTTTYVGCTTTLRADPRAQHKCEASPLTSIEELAELHTPEQQSLTFALLAAV